LAFSLAACLGAAWNIQAAGYTTVLASVALLPLAKAFYALANLSAYGALWKVAKAFRNACGCCAAGICHIYISILVIV